MKRTEMRRTMTYLIGALHQLQADGYVKNDGGPELSPKGIAEYDQLKASGFVPSEEAGVQCLETLSGGDEETARQMWRLIKRKIIKA